jgi:hypothetical protein
MLQKLADTTGEIYQHNQNFVKWWSNSTHGVRTYVSAVVSTTGGKISDIRLKMVREGWDNVRTCYKQYDENVSLFVPGWVVQCD